MQLVDLKALFLFLLLGIISTPLIAQTPPSRPAAVQAFKAADYSKAISLFKKAVKENANDTMSWYMLGSAYLKKGKNKDGVKALERAAKLDPKSESILIGLAFAYMLTGDIKAAATARAVLAINSKNVDAHYLLGQIALFDSLFNTAYERANKVLELSPNHAAAHRLKGEALLGSFAAQSGTIIRPPGNRNALLEEASVEFEKFLSLVKDETVRRELQDQIESLKAFAEYYSRKENSGPLDLDPVPEPGRVPLKIISKPRPGYTDSARQAGVQGTVHVLAVFKSDGKVGSVLIVKPLGKGLDQQAAAAAKRITFTPASKDGVPIAVVRRIEYTFSIY
jgi:TonB family protein